MEYVGSAQANGATSTTMPAHVAGDLLLLAAMRFTSSTIPGLGSGYTSALTGSGSSRGWRVGQRVAVASGTASGTWSNATDLNALVYRGAAGIGAVAASTNGVPALALQQPGVSWVAVLEVDYPAPPLPAGTVQRSAGDWWRFSDTAGPVASWPAQTTPARTASISIAIEVIPSETYVGGSFTPSWDVEAYVGGVFLPSWDVAELAVGGSFTPSWDVEMLVGGTFLPSWDVDAFGGWQDLARSTIWQAAVTATGALIDSYAELVNLDDGSVVPITVRGETLLRLPLSGAGVTYRSDAAEQWSATLSFADEWMVPTTVAHPLWGVSNLAIRLWWGVKASTWLWHPVCTVAIGDTNVADNGTISGDVTGRDLLSLIRDAYGAPLDVSGLTIDVAIGAILERVAPWLPLQVAETAALVPASTVLGDKDPLADIRELAAIGWTQGGIWVDRMGVAVVGPKPAPALTPLDWQDGVVAGPSTMSLTHGIEHMGNQVTVVSTHPDAEGLYVVVADDDPSSPTWVGGPWGVHPLTTIKSDKTTTIEGLRSLGLMALGKGLRPTEEIEVEVPQRPDLDDQHPVLLGNPDLGVAGVHRVDSWSLTLPVRGVDPAAMKVGLAKGYL